MVVKKLIRMAGNRILLDTNIISALLASDNNLTLKVDDADEVFIPNISIGELYYGAWNSTKIEMNLNAIKAVEKTFPVLIPDISTANVYGKLKTALRKKGKPIPENDIWIASISIQWGLLLISRDGHFKEVDELMWEIW